LPESVSDTEAMQIATAYIDAWNKRDRDAWLDLHHPDLELRPTALVGTGVVYRGIDGAARYFDDLTASDRAEGAEIVGLRRIDADRFLIELALVIDGKAVAEACVIAQVKDRKLVYTSGHFSDARTLASIGAIPEETTPLS